jgi:Flp pilus assembly protein TadD
MTTPAKPSPVALSPQGLAGLLKQAVLFYDRDQPATAVHWLRLAQVAAPADVRVLKLLAACLQRTGYKRQARDLYRQVLTLAPKDSDALTNLGEILIGQLAYEEALGLLQQSIELDPDYKNPSSQRARALVMQVVENLSG